MLSLSTVTALINQLLSEPHAGLLSGILFGTKASLSLELKDALIRSGMLHMVALSGMNITILINIAAATLSRVFSRRITSLLTIVIIIGFVLFVGISSSVVRAALMGSIALLSTVAGRQKHALYTLIFTGICMLIINISYLTEVSFQLSFLATLGLILFSKKDQIPHSISSSNPMPGLEQRHFNVRKKFVLLMWNFIYDDVHTSLAAQVFTWPIFVFQFHRISLLSPIANICIGWTVVPLTVLGLLMCFFSILYFPLAVPLSWVVWLFLQYQLIIIFFISKLPFSSISF